MATWQDVSDAAHPLPELEQEAGERSWRVRSKPVAWERPLRRGDLERLGASAPTGPILCVRVPDLDTKQARLDDLAPAVFVTPHFNGYPAVLIDLEAIDADDLAELIEDAWTAQAPKRVVKAWRETSGP